MMLRNQESGPDCQGQSKCDLKQKMPWSGREILLRIRLCSKTGDSRQIGHYEKDSTHLWAVLSSKIGVFPIRRTII